MTIKDFMTHKHRECDHFLAEAESAVESGDFDSAMEKYIAFKNETLKHFDMEEEYLFPMFEEKTGMTQGPTQVMRMEHSQAKSLFEKMDEAYNAKEEQMLYTMMQQHFMGENDEIVSKLTNW
jgi:iron-sulfur cluster repair protein YtfE (RIC family)